MQDIICILDAPPVPQGHHMHIRFPTSASRTPYTYWIPHVYFKDIICILDYPPVPQGHHIHIRFPTCASRTSYAY